MTGLKEKKLCRHITLSTVIKYICFFAVHGEDKRTECSWRGQEDRVLITIVWDIHESEILHWCSRGLLSFVMVHLMYMTLLLKTRLPCDITILTRVVKCLHWYVALRSKGGHSFLVTSTLQHSVKSVPISMLSKERGHLAELHWQREPQLQWLYCIHHSLQVVWKIKYLKMCNIKSNSLKPVVRPSVRLSVCLYVRQNHLWAWRAILVQPLELERSHP